MALSAWDQPPEADSCCLDLSYGARLSSSQISIPSIWYYAVKQTQDLTQYSESVEKGGTPSETSKEQPVSLILQLGLGTHSLLLSQDLKQGLTNEFKEEPSSVPFKTQSTWFINHKGLCAQFKPITEHVAPLFNYNLAYGFSV